MINKRKLLVLLLFSIILISSISAISAADSNVTDVQTVESEEIELEQVNLNQDEMQQTDAGDEKISAGDFKSFSELNNVINNNTDAEIVLTHDYKYNSTSDDSFVNGITLNRKLTIDGNGHIIDGCNNSARAFQTGGNGVIFKNITFLNLGKDSTGFYGGAIYCSYSGGFAKVQDCEFMGCKGYNGGAIYNVDANNCIFKDCNCYYYYGYGGAAFSGEFVNCTFEGNRAQLGNGGALYSGIAINCTFNRNQASGGGATYYSIVINSTFENNVAYYNGGALYSGIAINCSVIQNSAGGSDNNRYGGGMYGGIAILCDFVGNSGSNCGGAYGSSLILCTFKDNRVTRTGDNDYASCSFPDLRMITSTISGNCPSISLPLDLAYYNTELPNKYYPDYYYHFKGIPVNFTLYKENQYVETYQGLSGDSQALSLDSGNYTVRFSLAVPSSNKIGSNYNTCTLIVKGYKTVINATDLVIEYNNTANMTVTLIGDYYGIPLSNKTLNVIFDGNSSTVKTDENGQFNISVAKLPVNSYPVEIYFKGDDLYESSSLKNINVTIYKIATQLASGNVTAFHNEGKIFAKLTDKYGKPLVGSNVSLNLNYIHRTFKTNQSGEVEFDLEGLAEGNYTAQIIFANDAIYGDSATYINVYIYRLSSNLTADNLTFVFRESGILTANLKDLDGKPIENATIDLVIDKIYETLKTNSEGQVGFDMSNKLSVGTFNGYLYFDETNRYRASSIPVNVTVNKINTFISAPDVACTFGDEKYVIVTLNDKYGNPLANETVSVKLSIKTLTGKTNDSGQAKLLIDLPPKSYVGTVSYAGNGTYQSSSSSLNIVVNQINDKVATEITGYNLTSVYNEGKYITVTLKDGQGNMMGNMPLSIDFNGKTRNYRTDGNGQVKLSSGSLVPNSYVAKISFAGDDKYQSSSFSVNLVVKKAKAYLFASKKKFNAKTSVKKYKVTLKNNRNAAMKKVKIYLKVKGKTYVAKTNKKGQAIFKLKKLTRKGTYKATITYKGDNCYNGVVKKANIKVR